MKTAMVVLALGALGSCSSGPQTPPTGFPLPDGRKGYTAICNGDGNSMADCYTLAANFCGGRYEIVGEDQGARTYGSGGYIGTTTNRNVRFTCEVAPK